MANWTTPATPGRVVGSTSKQRTPRPTSPGNWTSVPVPKTRVKKALPKTRNPNAANPGVSPSRMASPRAQSRVAANTPVRTRTPKGGAAGPNYTGTANAFPGRSRKTY